jgi:hypothetical protein
MAGDDHGFKHRLIAIVHGAFALSFIGIVALFFAASVTLIWFSGEQLWNVFQPAEGRTTNARFVSILECIGLLTIAVAALELAETILEEEVQRSVAMSAPTRVRRFLSRFLVVVIVALTIECLVAVFRNVHDAPDMLPHAASIGVAAAALLAAWGVFVRLNTAAEKLEPEAIQEAQAEDEKVENRDARPDPRPDSRSPSRRPPDGDHDRHGDPHGDRPGAVPTARGPAHEARREADREDRSDGDHYLGRGERSRDQPPDPRRPGD